MTQRPRVRGHARAWDCAVRDIVPATRDDPSSDHRRGLEQSLHANQSRYCRCHGGLRLSAPRALKSESDRRRRRARELGRDRFGQGAEYALQRVWRKAQGKWPEVQVHHPAFAEVDLGDHALGEADAAAGGGGRTRPVPIVHGGSSTKDAFEMRIQLGASSRFCQARSSRACWGAVLFGLDRPRAPHSAAVAIESKS